MANSLSRFVDNLTYKIHKVKCKNFNCFFECETFKDNLIKYAYLPIKIALLEFVIIVAICNNCRIL